jgi:hypothetical protein
MEMLWKLSFCLYCTIRKNVTLHRNAQENVVPSLYLPLHQPALGPRGGLLLLARLNLELRNEELDDPASVRFGMRSRKLSNVGQSLSYIIGLS